MAQVKDERLRLVLRNTGRLPGLIYPGAKGLFVRKSGLKTDGALVGLIVGKAAALVDTYLQMKALERAHSMGALPWLRGWELSTRGVKFGRLRFDYSLRRGSERGFMEVKSAVYLLGELASYPDAPSERGLRHVKKLIEAACSGLRAVLTFVAAHPLARGFRPCSEVQPELVRELKRGKDQGVEPHAVKLYIKLNGSVVLDDPDLPIYLA